MLAIALSVAVATAAQEGPGADALFARGVELHQAGDVLGAIEVYQVVLEKEPDRVDARSNLGAAFARLGRYDEAVEHYRAALARMPERAEVRFNLALAYYKGARIPEAAEELVRVLEHGPSHAQAVLLLADCRAQMGDHGAVIALLAPREKELGEERLFAYLMGNSLIQRNELLRGQAYIERLFREADRAEARLLMGAAHLRRRDARAALSELDQAARLDPALPTVHALRGRALLDQRRREEAAAAFRRELEGNPNDFESNLYLGLALKDEGRLDEAHEHLKRAGRLRSQDPAVLYGLGALHLAGGRLEEARQALERVTAAVPGYRQAHVLLATAYYRQKKKELGDRERAIAEKLAAEQQAREPGASDILGPGYRGEERR